MINAAALAWAAMRKAGIGVAVAFGGTVLFALVAWLLGAGWRGVLLAAVTGATTAALAGTLFELRRLHRRLAGSAAAASEQVRDLSASVAALRRSADAQARAVWEYLRAGPVDEPDTFVLYRIAGNDLPPRHRAGQTIENLRFIVEHEPPLPGCQKRWVVNRIVDPAVEKQVIALLEQHRLPYLHLPFDVEEYRRIGWRFDGFPVPGFTYRPEFADYSPMQQQWALDHVYHDKNLYVMNNNGARNAALAEGRGLAKWVLPWDGNCFLTRQAWDELVAAVTSRPYLKYFTVPMARIVDNQLLLRPDLAVDPTEEPQLLFRRDARERFDPSARYGRCPKVELFWRLGIDGPWDRWCRGPWDPARAGLSPEAGQVGRAGWVARLSSGATALERDYQGRAISRSEAVQAQIDRLDERLAARTFDATAPVAVDLAGLDRQREAWRRGEPGPARVVGQLIEAAEGTGDPLVAVLAGLVTGEPRFHQRAAAAVRAHSRDRDPRAAHPPGLHHLLDAARLLEREGALPPADAERLRGWLAEHRSWLCDSDQGRAARAALDHRGTWYDAELAAIDAYLGDRLGLLATLRRAHERVGQQFDLDDQSNLAAGNLLGWVVLAELAERAGQPLWPRLAGPIEAARGDRHTLAVLAYEAAGAVPARLASLDPAERDPYRLPQVFGERDGVRPFWSLGNRAAAGDPEPRDEAAR